MNRRLKLIYVAMFAIMMLVFAGCSNNTNSSESIDINNNNTDNPEKVTIYFFWGDGCPHCATQKPFLEELEQEYGNEIEVKMFETWKNPNNAKFFQEVAQAYGTTAQGVPTTFIGEEHWVGYADSMGQEMEQKILYCLENDCVNPGDKLVSN